MSARFRGMAAQAADWKTATMICAEAVAPVDVPALGVVYVTHDMAPHMAKIVEMLAAVTGVIHWVGGCGAGVCGAGQEFHDGYALSILIMTLPDDVWSFLPSLRQPEDAADAVPEDWGLTARPLVGLVHGDPRNAAVNDIVSLLPETLDGYLVGGLVMPSSGAGSMNSGQVVGTISPTASDEPKRTTASKTITGGGLSGVLFGADVPVSVGLSQGCVPLGDPHVITSMEDDWIMTLDGRPALDVLRDEVGPLPEDGFSSLSGEIHAAVPVEGSDTADYLVRTLVGLDPHEAALGVAAELVEGDRVMFVRRDRASAEADLRAMIGRVLARAKGKPPRGAIYISCLARGHHLFGAEHGELRIVAEELGPVPLAGFFAGGEISHNRLYTHTGVLMLFL
jgi:small ligand-binding sensory domain FIST